MLTTGTRFVRYIRLFRPIYSNYLQEVISVLTGQRTEYNDPKFVCRAEGRKGNVEQNYSNFF